ncbi:putative peptidase [Corynebacterium ciconiae DSM 44920]|uniref:M23 family metallopeptidase n=1 Tax=Corynebacterium ciconiae TaxID=227319 RepID=UPI000380EB3C|nr:M23 family metallopeptidase [Corynebacterium ciconiae]WKD61475.1 putative peptidase [Corynebacterium ciconiae DSM 44920]
MRRILVVFFVVALQLLGSPLAVAYVDPATGRPHASQVIRAFDKPAQNWLPGHRGVDLAAEVGAPVLAAEDGVVAFAGTVARTPTVSIDHADGVRTTYQPVHYSVQRGDNVRAGDIIGRLAAPTTRYPGLQWGARRDGEYINPLSLLSRPTIRLKPLAG